MGSHKNIGKVRRPVTISGALLHGDGLNATMNLGAVTYEYISRHMDWEPITTVVFNDRSYGRLLHAAKQDFLTLGTL